MELVQNISQRQTITQSMLKQLSVLQMNVGELTEYIQEVALENPVTDLDEIRADIQDEEWLRKMEWLNQFDEQNRIYYQQDKEDSDLDNIMNIGHIQEDTLAESLRLQLINKPYSDVEFRIFNYIAESLDSRGYFMDSLEEAAVRLRTDREKVGECLEVMKRLEPSGVCAGSVKECLRIQLEQMETVQNGDYSIEKIMIEKYMELLGKNQLHVIAKELGEDIKRIQEAGQRIRSLNPKPSNGYPSRETMQYLTPDVIVVRSDENFEVLVNDWMYPALRINQGYIKMLKDSKCDKEVRQYLADKVRQIEQIQGCIFRRNSTLTELSKFLIEKQQPFFLYGKDYMTPLRMSEAANALNLHVSTISRAVKEKYLQCRWGIFSMDYFFSKGISSSNGQEAVTTDWIKERIKKLIFNENKRKPFSDQKLAEKLNEDGITISRRTVAKYRENMEIPDCRVRKQF